MRNLRFDFIVVDSRSTSIFAVLLANMYIKHKHVVIIIIEIYFILLPQEGDIL